jgi:hypothetical protein
LEQLQVFALMENKCTEVVWPFLNVENDGSVRLGVESERAKGKMCSCPCTTVAYKSKKKMGAESRAVED